MRAIVVHCPNLKRKRRKMIRSSLMLQARRALAVPVAVSASLPAPARLPAAAPSSLQKTRPVRQTCLGDWRPPAPIAKDSVSAAPGEAFAAVGAAPSRPERQSRLPSPTLGHAGHVADVGRAAAVRRVGRRAAVAGRRLVAAGRLPDAAVAAERLRVAAAALPGVAAGPSSPAACARFLVESSSGTRGGALCPPP